MWLCYPLTEIWVWHGINPQHSAEAQELRKSIRLHVLQDSPAKRLYMRLGFQAIGVTGGYQPHNNMQQYFAINFIIALEGVYPPKQ